MNLKQEIIQKLKALTNHHYIEILTRGNAAIFSALHAADKEILIPKEGGWLAYLQYSKRLGLKSEKVKCRNAVISLKDLEKKLSAKNFSLFLYQNPGGYHAEQPMEEIYRICRKNNCLVVLDASGGIGTRLCDGNYADIILCSFGRWKLIDARTGGFISCKDKRIFDKIKPSFQRLEDKAKREISKKEISGVDKDKLYQQLETILKKINSLSQRLSFLLKKREKVIKDLEKDNIGSIINKNHLGFVLIIKFAAEKEREKIINYCKNNSLEYTECPRYIRLNQKAISIEVKRL